MAVLLQKANIKNLASNAHQISSIFVFQKRGIYGKITREILKIPPRPAPFPWREKKLRVWKTWFDTGSRRLDENSKIIVVDGPPAVGKTQFAKQLAADFDMWHINEANLDLYYITRYGYDLRKCDPDLPESAKSFDHTDFCRNPRHRLASRFQFLMYTFRYMQYFDAVAHLLNTGQGVVLERSPFSDFIFTEAMQEVGYIRKEVLDAYNLLRETSIIELLRPHLVVYLDIPVDVVKDRIKKRNLPHEQNSPALTDEYLSTLERIYKEKYLKEMSAHAEVLMYDWTTPGDAEIVVEDIERINFNKYTRYDESVHRDWRFSNEALFNDQRMKYTNYWCRMMEHLDIPCFDVEELTISGEDDYTRTQVYEKVPGITYEYGFNKLAGDKNIMFKTKLQHRMDFDY